jgi:hypothetical protein
MENAWAREVWQDEARHQAEQSPPGAQCLMPDA